MYFLSGGSLVKTQRKFTWAAEVCDSWKLLRHVLYTTMHSCLTAVTTSFHEYLTECNLGVFSYVYTEHI